MPDNPFHHPSNDGINILLVEDNPGDVRLIQEAFKLVEQEVTLQVVSNGDDAVHFLMQQTTDDTFPRLVLLDLNLPGRDGCEVLEAIRDDPQLNPLPVIVITSSEADEDIARSYNARANAYLTKPTDPGEFIALVQRIERFWLNQAQLPPIPL